MDIPRMACAAYHIRRLLPLIIVRWWNTCAGLLLSVGCWGGSRTLLYAVHFFGWSIASPGDLELLLPRLCDVVWNPLDATPIVDSTPLPSSSAEGVNVSVARRMWADKIFLPLPLLVDIRQRSELTKLAALEKVMTNSHVKTLNGLVMNSAVEFPFLQLQLVETWRREQSKVYEAIRKTRDTLWETIRIPKH